MDFDRLQPTPEEMQALSNLAASEALTDLAVLEEAVRQTEDAIFEVQGRAMSDFISYGFYRPNSSASNRPSRATR
jgi:hypothetical protein